jgi:hypothetical protein
VQATDVIEVVGNNIDFIIERAGEDPQLFKLKCKKSFVHYPLRAEYNSIRLLCNVHEDDLISYYDKHDKVLILCKRLDNPQHIREFMQDKLSASFYQTHCLFSVVGNRAIDAATQTNTTNESTK